MTVNCFLFTAHDQFELLSLDREWVDYESIRRQRIADSEDRRTWFDEGNALAEHYQTTPHTMHIWSALHSIDKVIGLPLVEMI